MLFKGVTDSFTLQGGTYQVRVMDAGTSRVVLDTPVTLVEGTVQTFVLIDSEDGSVGADACGRGALRTRNARWRLRGRWASGSVK